LASSVPWSQLNDRRPATAYGVARTNFRGTCQHPHRVERHIKGAGSARQAQQAYSALRMDYELEQRLDAFVRGESVETAFIEEFCAVCATTPDFTWDALATTDQYYRRGKISAELNRRIRYAIVRPALTRRVAVRADATPIAPVAQLVAPEELQALRYDLFRRRTESWCATARASRRSSPLAADIAMPSRRWGANSSHHEFIPSSHSLPDHILRRISRRRDVAPCRIAPNATDLAPGQCGFGHRNSWQQSPFSWLSRLPQRYEKHRSPEWRRPLQHRRKWLQRSFSTSASIASDTSSGRATARR
jgi:hypothetical protein